MDDDGDGDADRGSRVGGGVTGVPCDLAGACGGCGWHDRSPSRARQDRLAAIADGLTAVGVALPAEVLVEDTPTLGFRDKFDFGLSRREGPLVIGLSRVDDRAFLDACTTHTLFLRPTQQGIAPQ